VCRSSKFTGHPGEEFFGNLRSGGLRLWGRDLGGRSLDRPKLDVVDVFWFGERVYVALCFRFQFGNQNLLGFGSVI
jgi:hypothetical protein